MLNLSELKQRLLEGETVEVGWNDDFAGRGLTFSDHGRYGGTYYSVAYDDGKYHVYLTHSSDDGAEECDDDIAYGFESFDSLVDWFRHVKLNDCPFNLPFGKIWFDDDAEIVDCGDHVLAKTFDDGKIYILDDSIVADFISGQCWRKGFLKTFGFYYPNGSWQKYNHYLSIDEVEFIMIRGFIFKFAKRGCITELNLI